MGSKMQYLPPATISRAEFLDGSSDSEFRTIIYALQFCAARLLACREALGRKIHLTPNQFVVLMSVARTQAEDGITIRQLAEHASLASTHATTEVSRLEAAGLVKKTPGKRDKRQVLVFLTPKGVEAIERVAPTIQQVNDMLFQGVDAKSFQIVGQVVRKITENSRDALTLAKSEKEKKVQVRPRPRSAKSAAVNHATGRFLSGQNGAGRGTPDRRSLARASASRKKELTRT